MDRRLGSLIRLQEKKSRVGSAVGEMSIMPLEFFQTGRGGNPLSCCVLTGRQIDSLRASWVVGIIMTLDNKCVSQISIISVIYPASA